MIVLTCPGQGSQTPGFLSDWIEDSQSRSTLEAFSEASKVDLIKHGTESDADTIRDTSIAQPLIVAASILSWKALAEKSDLSEVGVAGHSVGEFAAAVIAGVLSAEDALMLVGERGRAMAKAAAQNNTSMAAVIGDEDTVLKLIENTGLTAANRNGAKQVVAAGLKDRITRLVEDAPRGIRIVPLQVAGAFHTEHMQPAISELALAAKNVSVSDPNRKLWTNVDGSLVTSGKSFLDSLISQIANPVRWDLCLESFAAEPLNGFVELSPAGALSGIAKRALRGTPNVAIKTPADISVAAEVVNNS